MIVSGEGGAVVGVAWRISTSGMLLYPSRSCDPGRWFTVTLILPEKSLWLEVEATRICIERVGERDAWHIAFVNLTAETRARLHTLEQLCSRPLRQRAVTRPVKLPELHRLLSESERN